jgi:hypothetical protein
MTHVSVVVLSHDRPALLEKALASIAAQTCPEMEVLVIDNLSPSSERIREMVPTRFPGMRLIANPENRGFTGGMNQGIAEATGEYIYLTEDDVELAPDCVSLILDYLRQHPETGLASPVMWNRHAETIRCAGGRFTLGARFRLEAAGEGAAGWPDDKPYRTTFIPGATVGARTAFLREVGGFHPDFFIYHEDVELCCKVLERGRPIVVVPRARVFHFEPEEGRGGSPLLEFHKNKNLSALYLLHAPWTVLPEYFLRYALVDGARRLAGNRRSLGSWSRAWRWVACRTPRLLAERRRGPTAIVPEAEQPALGR